jgi:DNA-binding CsgD family transcriptional regulator
MLGMSIKTVSFRKNKVIEKIGLINKNNFMFFGLMRFVLKAV